MALTLEENDKSSSATVTEDHLTVTSSKVDSKEEELNEEKDRNTLAGVRLARRLRVLSPEDLSLNDGNDISTITLVTRKWNSITCSSGF